MIGNHVGGEAGGCVPRRLYATNAEVLGSREDETNLSEINAEAAKLAARFDDLGTGALRKLCRRLELRDSGSRAKLLQRCTAQLAEA